MVDSLGNGATGDANREEVSRGYYGLPVLKTPVWRWEVWGYFFLGGLAAGSYLIASFAALFGDERDRIVSRVGYLISFAAFLGCPPLLVRDLGRPTRFLNMLRVFKPESPMSMGVWGLIGFGVCSATSAALAWWGENAGPLAEIAHLVGRRRLAAIGSALAAFVGGYTGVLLSVTSVPLWSRSRYLGPAFLASAVASGVSAISLVLSVKGGPPDPTRHKLDRVKVAATLGEAIALAGFVRTTGRAAKPLLAREQYGRHFLAGVVGLGMVIPLLALAASPPRRGRATAVASLCSLVGGILLRYAFVEGGRASAEDPEATFWHTDFPEEKRRR